MVHNMTMKQVRSDAIAILNASDLAERDSARLLDLIEQAYEQGHDEVRTTETPAMSCDGLFMRQYPCVLPGGHDGAHSIRA